MSEKPSKPLTPSSGSSNSVTALTESHKTKIAAAKQKYGKPFAHEIKIERSKPPSFLLKHITAQQEAAADKKITDIKRWKKEKA